MATDSRSIGDRIAALSPAKRALLEQQLLALQAGASLGTHNIVPRSGPGPWPISFAQLRLWLLQQLDPANGSYALHHVLRLRGPLNVDALRHAQDSLLARHEVLRTVFGVQNGQPVQIVCAPRPVPMPQLDLRSVDPSERETRALEAIQAQTELPFDLSRDLMLRTALVRLADDEYFWLMEEHHIAFDGHSSHIRERELVCFYNGYVTGQGPSLPALPVQYADYALWQHARLKELPLEKPLSYWRAQLAGAPATIDLPSDRPRPAVMDDEGGLIRTVLPAELATRLRAFCRSNELTPFMGLLTAFKILLHRYSGQEDIVVGVPVSGRNRLELENMIGFFINTLALRSDLSGNPSFREVAQRVRKVVVDGITHQELPFERLVEELRPERSPGYSPIVQLTCQLKAPVRGGLAFNAITASDVILPRRRAPFDLSLDIDDTPNTLPCSWEYRSSLFDPSTVYRMAGHLEALLSDALARPDIPINRLHLMGEAERLQVLLACNDNRREFPAYPCVYHAFEAQAARTPGANAVEGNGQSLTYAELNARANRLARRLQQLGAGPESLVGLCIERSPDMLVGLLGILKAGAAFVPLDPAYPAERLSFMQSDARIDLLVTTTAVRDGLATGATHVICLDTDAALPSLPTDNLNTSVSGANTAYVIYTSGSTGLPKGVLSTHSGLLNHNWAVIELLGLTAADRVMQFATLSFDTANEEIFPTLLCGATLVLRPPTPVPGISEFECWVREQRLTMLDLPTAYWHTWVESFDESAPAPVPDCVRVVFIGGEAVHADHWRRWHKLVGPRVRMLDGYGPTEATINATEFESPLAVEYQGPFVPIGRPLANVRAYVLDPALEPSPIGIAGELYVGGAGVARGYHGRPELTAEKFVPDPFGGEAGARLYRTGDRVRRLVDGNIEYLGRVDRQFKLRGFRIEPAEIEAALRRHPDVSDCALLIRRGRTGGQLTAYLVPRRAPPDPGGLRAFLKTLLPEYMLPETFITLESLPQTPSGKLDYAALEARPGDKAPPVPYVLMPRSLLERQLLQLWEAALGVAPIGVSDNFFELGGHSLLAVKLFTQIEKAFGRSLPVSLIFEAPSVEMLAKLLNQEGWEPVWSRLVGVQPHGTLPPLFCITPFGHGIEFYSLANQLGNDQPLYALVANRDGDPTRFKSVAHEAETYLAEIQMLQPHGPYFLLGYSSGAAPALEVAQLMHARGLEVALLGILDFGFHRQRSAPPVQEWSRRAITFARLGPRTQLERVSSRMRGWLKKPLPAAAPVPAPRAATAQPAGMNRVKPSAVPAAQRPRSRYDPRTYQGHVSLFRTQEQGPERAKNLERVWRQLAAGGLDVIDVPGDHFNLMQEPHVQVLAASITKCLAQARQGLT